jgi:lipoyl(octanoyl) transferase
VTIPGDEAIDLPAGPASQPDDPLRRRWRAADYQTVLGAMRRFTEERDDLARDELWQVEHPAVFTLGQAASTAHIVRTTDIPVVRTERGGPVTYHGPGQVVIYCLIDIRRRNIFVRDMVYRLESSMIDTLIHFGLKGATRRSGAPGVYVPDTHPESRGHDGLAKIGAIGLKVSRGRTYHGLALNVAMDLAPFSTINPCGYPGLRTVDMATMGSIVSWEGAAEYLCTAIDHQLRA